MRRNQRKQYKTIYKTEQNKIIKYIGIIIAILIICLIVVSISNRISSKKALEKYLEESAEVVNSEENIGDNEETDEEDSEEEAKDRSFTLTAIGDTLCHNTQYWDAYNKTTGEYDFSYVYEDISYYTKIGDLTIGSLETSFAGEDRGYSNYPTFNSPDSLATALKKIGVDIISTAGNHALDYGYTGLSRTIDVLDEADLSHLGTYKTQEDQEKLLYKYVKGVKIAFINYTYGTNGIAVPEGKEYCINLIDKDLMKKQIEQAKEEGANVIVACIHWGIEYQTSPSSEQEELADFLFTNGVDVIIGNHPHCLEPMEKRTIVTEDGEEKEVFVIYALGNFTADQTDEITRDSIILNLKLTYKTDGKLSIDKAEYVPIYMYKNANIPIGSHKFKLLDIEKEIAKYETGGDTSIGTTVYNNLKTQLEKIKSIVGEEIN